MPLFNSRCWWYYWYCQYWKEIFWRKERPVSWISWCKYSSVQCCQLSYPIIFSSDLIFSSKVKIKRSAESSWKILMSSWGWSILLGKLMLTNTNNYVKKPTYLPLICSHFAWWCQPFTEYLVILLRKWGEWKIVVWWVYFCPNS